MMHPNGRLKWTWAGLYWAGQGLLLWAVGPWFVIADGRVSIDRVLEVLVHPQWLAWSVGGRSDRGPAGGRCSAVAGRRHRAGSGARRCGSAAPWGVWRWRGSSGRCCGRRAT
ncbi:MAG: hypothetical protein KIT68_01445 [Phycisphaeraceae bacterium]|nr:hypothetical protein [Phycisphaeraceae bacterium]